jgi:hypothetical protein
MRWRSSTVSDESARAWFAGTITFVVTLTLIAIIAPAKSAQASPPPVALALTGPSPALPGMPFVTVFDEEAEEEAGEEGEEGEEGEAEEEAEGESARAGAEPPYECVLRTARATIVAMEAQSKLRLQLSYTSFEPAPAILDYQLRGGKGSLALAGGHRHLAESGVLRETKTLSDYQLAKVMAAKTFTIRIRVPGAPGYCSRYSSRQLKAKREAPGKVTWLQSGSVFGA